MKKKNHDTAPDKRVGSISIPIVLWDATAEIAKREDRSRNKVIERLLTDAVARYWIDDAEKRARDDVAYNERLAGLSVIDSGVPAAAKKA